MDIWFSEKQRELKALTRKIALEMVLPKRGYYDDTEDFPWDVVNKLASAGLFEAIIPEEHGGKGGGITEMCIVTEELSKVCGGIALSFAGTALGINPILLFGNQEQKSRYLPGIARGEKLAAFGLTEANAGSDASSIQTQAKTTEEGYILNGAKQWITNGGEAEVYTIIAITDKSKGPRGASAFIVEKGYDGFTFGKKEKKMGIRASSTRELIFNNCFVPKENLLGKEGSGFIIAMKTFDRTRPGVAAQALGIARGALDEALNYTRRRKQFGQSICSFQDIQFKLSDMATQIEAARALVYSVAKLIDSGTGKFSKESSMAKVFASDVAVKVTTMALQIFGGYGYLREYPVEKMMRDAKITQIYEGTNEIQRGIIALKLIKETAS
ncbi:MAG: acyl-CoA dehydrogenase family protein [candidate division Zixibacteria bacterium]|nr:acyl-CoA dehydrogenase family protein [candidate division Zixibacteria bacterium]